MKTIEELKQEYESKFVWECKDDFCEDCGDKQLDIGITPDHVWQWITENFVPVVRDC